MNYLLEFREDDVGGPVVKGRLKVLPNGPEWVEANGLLMLERHLLFLIHGFNVDRESGTTGLGNLSEFIRRTTDSAVVSVLWPGDHWAKFLSYPFEGRDADDTAKAFAEFIDIAVRPDATLSFVTHSMGARVALETVKRVMNSRSIQINQICLMAPAIDDFSLLTAADYRAACETSNRVAVLSSVEDEVLRWAYPVGDLLESFFFSDNVSGAALGYKGPPNVLPSGETLPAKVIHKAIPADRNSDHSDYIPEFGADDVPHGKKQKNQKSAALYSDQVVNGDPTPAYT